MLREETYRGNHGGRGGRGDRGDDHDKYRDTSAKPESWSYAQLGHGVVGAAFFIGANFLWRSEPLSWELTVCFAALSFDNFVLFCGVYMGPGRLLDVLSRLRYFGYVAASPLLLTGVVKVAARGGVVWLDRPAIGTTETLSAMMLGIFILRELLGALRGPSIPAAGPARAGQLNPDYYRPGDCLATSALLGGNFVLHVEGAIVRYVPNPPRENDRVPTGLAVLASITLGWSLKSETGRGYLLYGGLCMMASQFIRERITKDRMSTHIGEVLWLAFCALEWTRTVKGR